MPEAAGFSKDDFEAWKRSSKPPPLEDHEFDPADFDDWKKRRAAQAAITYPAEEPAGAKPAVPIVPGGTISPGRTALLPGREYGLSDAQRAAQAPGAEEPPAAPFRQGGILAAAEPREPPPKLAEAPHVRDPRVLDAITRYAEGDFSAPVTGTIGLLAQDLYKGRYPKGTPDRELVERTVKAAIWARHYKIGPDAVLKLLGDTPENRALAGWTAYLDEQAREHGAPSKQALFEKNFYRQNIPEGAAPPTTGERLGELPRRALHGAAGGVAAGLELPGQVLEMGGRALPPGPAAAATQAVGMSLRRLPQAARELLEEAIAKPPPPGSRDEGFLETMLQAGVEEASALYGMGYSPFVKAAGKLGRAAVPLLPAGALGEEVLGKKLSQAGQIGRQAGQAAVTMGAFQVPEALEVIDRLDRGEPPGDITGQMLHSAYLIGLFELVGRGKGLMRLQRIARSGMPNNPHLTAEQQGLIRAAAREALKGVPEALTREVGPRMEGPQFRLFKDQSIPDALREAVENIRFEEAKGPAETQRALAGRLGKLTPEQMLAETEELRLANAPGAAIRKWAGTLNRLGLTAALERASQKSPGGKMAMILTEELQRRQFGRPEQGPTVPYGKKGKPTFAESVSGEAPGEVIRSMRRIGTGGRRVPPAERPPRAEVPEEVAAPPSSVRPGGIRSPESGLLEGLREAGFDPQKLARAGVAEANRLWEEFHGAGTASERGRILEEFNGPRAVTEAPRAPGEKVITPVIPPPPAPVERGAPPPSVPPEAGPAPPAGPLDRQMADLFARGLPDKEIAKRLYNAGLVKSGEGTRIVREARERLDVPTDPEALRQWAEERVPAEQRQAIATAESELSKALGRTQYPNAAEAQEAIQGKLDRGTKLTPAERDVADALEALEKAHAGEQGFVDLEGAKRRKTGRPAAPGGASSIEAEGISREGISRVIARFRADTGKAAWFEEGRLKVADEADLPKLSELVYGRAFEEAEEPPQGKPAEKPPEKPPEPVPPEGKPPKAPPPPTTPGPKAPPPAPAQPPEPEPPTERPAAVDLGVVREGLSKIGSGIEEFDAVVNRREAAAIDRQARIEAKREVQADSLLRDVPTDKLPELFGADNRDRVHVGKVPTPLLGNGAKDWAAIEWLKRQKAKRLPPAEAAPLPPTPVPEAPRQERRASVRFPPSPETANATVEAVGGKMLAGLRKMQAEGIPMTDDAMREHLGDDATSSLILNGVLVRDKANPEVFLPVDMLRAKIGPVPEGPATIEAQLEALRRGDKPLMLIPKGQKAPVLDDKLFGRLSGPDGTWIFKRGAPKALLAELRKWKATGEPTPEADKARLLGYPSEKPAPGEPAVTVTGRTAAGVEAESQVVPPEKAEEAAEQVGKVAGPGGAVEVGGEEQARKVIEERQEAPKPAVRQEGKPFAPAASGGQSIVRTESFTGVETRWAVVDGDRLLTSSSEGYDQAIQPRNVKRAAVDAQREAIKAKPDFEALGEAYLASNGSPLVNKRSMVVSGNRRTEAILELYRDAPEVAKQYRAWIARNRQKFGLVDLSDEALAGMKRPVLARLIERDFTPEDEITFAEEANKSSTLEMAAAETASRDARALVADPDLMAKFMPGEDGKIDVASNRAFIKGFFGLLTPTERGDAITKEGAVSKQGIERIRLAIFSAAYGEGDVLERLAEGGDSEIKLVTTAMMAAAGPVIRVKGMAARDEIQKLDMSGEIGEAARALGRIRRTEKNVEKAIQSHGEQMFLGDPDPAHTQRIQTWLELMGLKSNGFHKSAAYMADLFKTYADIAEHTDPPGQGRLIGEAKNWTKEEVLAAAIVKVRDQYGKGPTIFESRSEEGEGVAPGGAEKQEGAPPEGEGKPEAFVYILTRNNGDRVDVRFASQDDLALFSYAMNPRAAEGNRLAEKLKIPRGQLDKAAADYRKAVMQIAAGGTAGPWGLTQVAAPAAVHPKPLAPERIEGPKAPSERNKDLDVLEKFFGGEEKPPEPPKGSLAQITIKTPPPEVLRAATTYGAALVRDEGLTKFDDWKARMIADVKSDRIGPFLDPIWKRIKVGNPDLAQKMEDAGAAIQPTKGPTAEGPKPPTAAGGPRPGVGSEQPVAGGGRKRQPIITIEPDRTSRVDVSGLDPTARALLDDHQQQGTAKAILAMDNRPAGGGFILGDGTGVGKTWEIMAVAGHYAKRGQSILVIAPAGTLKFKEGQLTGAYPEAAKAMGLEFEIRGSGDLRPLKAGSISLTTYERFTPAVVDENTVLVWDEAHKLKNPWSDRSRKAERAIEKAASVMFATATPMDKPGHIYYMMRAGLAEGRKPEEVLKGLGFIKTKMTTPKGEQTFTWEINPNVGEAKVLERIDAAFARLIERGFAVKREVSMERMTVGFQNTPIDDAAWDTLGRIYTGFDGDNARGIVRANMLMNMMRQLEPYKIPEAVRMVSESLAKGHQAIVYVNRINYSEAARNIRAFNPATGRVEIVDRIVFAKSDGTMETLTKKLQAIGIKDIAHLHGRAGEFGAKSPGEEVEKFNTGKARVMLATPQSGQEGISLDDVKGDRPREMLIVTAPFDGMGNVQAWGRINRLFTASDSTVTYLSTDTEPDRWIRKIVLAKARTMKAALKGQGETELKGKVEAPLGMAEPLGLKTAPTAREKLNATEKALEAARALPAPTEGVVRLYRFRGGEEEGGPQYYSASPAIAQAFAMREYGGEIVYTDVSKAEAETGRSKSDPGQYYLSPSGELKSLGIIPGRKSTSADVERIRNEPTQEPTVKPLADLSPGGAGAVAPQATLPAATTPNQAMRKVSVFDPLSWTLLNRARASGDPDTWRKLLLSRHEFIEQLQDMMERMIRLRALKRGKGIAGQYWPGPAPGHAGESIETLRRGSVWTVFHEMGHYFQGMVYPGKASEFPETMAQEIRRIALRAGLTETAIKKERDALNKDYGKREYGPESEAAGAAGALGRKGAEAFAQFIRLEVTNPDEAERRAPTLTKVWRETLGQHKDIKMILDWARDQWKLWEESPDEAKFDSHIVRTSGKLRWALTREDFFRMATDDIGPFTEASDQMLAGRDIDPAANPKILAETARGWIGKGYSDIEVGTHKFATPGILDGVSLKAALEPAKKRIKDFERYAVWRDEQYSRKLRENDIEDAMAAGQKPLAAWDPLEMMGLEQQWLDAVGNRLGNDPAMKRAFALTQQFADHHLEYWRDAEFFTPERTAKIKERRQIYVPLMRYMMDDLSGIGVIGGGQKAGVGAQLANIWPTIKRRFGSERPILSPVESWIKLTMLMHNRVERNEAVKAWAKLVRDHPFGGKWGVVTDEMPQEPVSVNVRDAIRKAGGNPDDLGDNLAGFVTIFRDSIKPPSPRSVWFWEGGERKMLTFRSEAVYKSVMAMDRQQWPWIVRAMQAPLRVGRASIVLGIPFQIRNIERDQITAKIRSQAAYQIWRFPKNWTEVILGHDVPRALLGGLGVSDSTIAKWNGSIRSELGTPEKREPLLQKYARAGTSMAHFMDLSYDQVVKRIERDLADIPSGKAARLAWAANPVKHARAILDALETMSLSIETATRFQEAKKFGLEKAVTRGEMLKAGHAARVLTIDFGRAGTVSRAINSIAWFFNPGVQGFSVNYQLAKDAVLHRNNRTMTQLTTRLLGALVVPTLAMYVANRDDKRYWNLPPDYRARHWIYFPFDPDSPWADVHIKFAAPHDFFGGIKAGVEDLAAWVDKQEPDKLDDFLNYMTSQSPNPMPTLPLPFIENLAPQGWKFWGERPMMGEAEARGLPEWEGVGDENVAWMAKALGRGLSIAMPPGSAGRRVVPEQFFSPRKLDNILRTLFPSIISSGTDVTEWLMGLRDKPERAIRDLVGTSAVTGESRFNTAQVGKLYDHWRIVSEIKSTLDNLKREDTHEEALRFEKENREALDQYDLLKPVIDAIGAERKEAKRLSRLEEFTPEQRREQQKAPAARAHESAQRGLADLYLRRQERYRAFAPQKPQSP